MVRTTKAMKQQYKDLTNAVMRLQPLDQYEEVSEPFYGTSLVNKFIQMYGNELLKKGTNKAKKVLSWLRKREFYYVAKNEEEAATIKKLYKLKSVYIRDITVKEGNKDVAAKMFSYF